LKQSDWYIVKDEKNSLLIYAVDEKQAVEIFRVTVDKVVGEIKVKSFTEI